MVQANNLMMPSDFPIGMEFGNAFDCTNAQCNALGSVHVTHAWCPRTRETMNIRLECNKCHVRMWLRDITCAAKRLFVSGRQFSCGICNTYMTQGFFLVDKMVCGACKRASNRTSVLDSAT